MTLTSALSENRLKLVRRKLEAGAKVNTEEDGIAPLHFAAFRENLRAVQLLFEFGADVAFKDLTNQNTALHYAAQSGCWKYSIYKLLLEKGSDCNSRNNEGITPLHYILQHHNMKFVQLLLDHGADIKAVDRVGWTALHYLCRNPHLDVIEFVLKQGLDIEYGDINDYSPLHFVAAYGSPEGCELFLKGGAMVNKKSSKKDHTPMSFAIFETSRARSFFDQPMEYIETRAQMVHILLEYGARITDKVADRTILEIAADENSYESCIRNVLMQHVAKMRYMNLHINEYDRQTIENENCYREYYQRCLHELEDMKETKFYNDVSILDIILKNRQVISRYARNEELVNAFEENDFSNKFPIYFAWLKRKFGAEVEKQRLRNMAAKYLANVFNFNDPSHQVNQKIINFLSDEDLNLSKTRLLQKMKFTKYPI